MHLTHRSTCRVCGSSSLTKVIYLGEQHLQGSFVKPGKELPPMRHDFSVADDRGDQEEVSWFLADTAKRRGLAAYLCVLCLFA